jgi:hypothetical protein
MVTRDNVTRFALAAALVGLAATIGWVGLTRPDNNAPAVWFGAALVPLATAGLLFIRPAAGAALAVVAALLGAFMGLVLQFCLFCPTVPTLTAGGIALYAVSAVVLALSVIELRSRGLAWVAVVILVAAMLLANNFLAAGLIVTLAIAWFVVQRRRAIP